MNRILRVVRATALTALARVLAAQAPAPLTPQIRTAVLDSVIASVTAVYVEADTAKMIAGHMRAQIAKHAYDAITNPAEFGLVVSRDLRAINNDLHLVLRYSPVPPTGAAAPPSPGPTEEQRRLANYGMGRAEILAGNVGYLEITGSYGGDFQDAVVDALRFLSRTDALIIDLRRNSGGEGAPMQFILSHFLGKSIPITDTRTRNSPQPQRTMTLAKVPGPRRTDMPLYILTSGGTASGGEAFAFVLHNQKRATIVGARTLGAGHGGILVPVGHGFELSVSTVRVSDPATGQEYERVGVSPDINVPAEAALDVAHGAALNAILATDTLSPARVNTIRRQIATIEARVRATATNSATLARFAGTYDSRSFIVRDGNLWYVRVVGALPEALVPLTGDTFALGAIRFRFAATSGSMSVTIEQPDGTTITFSRTQGTP